ncbi:FtsX-like permease family protein [Microtetraspora sp. NBRC 13810]|uniref:FtsX-like permease family protein n=1 Tax=Microtetraspora sp. NBRC 13810 TaxID=3030990 RepID=UPI0025563E56|nr:FtsX-like permease family protein [Microtetraspora sp. NBRC 13810]
MAQGARDHVTAPVAVVAAGAAALPDTVAAAARRAPGVTAAVRVKRTSAYDREDGMVRQRAAWYVDGPDVTRVLRLPVTAGSAAGLTGGAVAVAQTVADAHGWRVGSQATLRLGDGAAVRLRVAATYRDRLGLPAFLLAWPLASGHTAVPAPDAVYLALAPKATATATTATATPTATTASAAAVIEAVEAAVRPLGGTVVPTAVHLAAVDAEFDSLARLALLAIIGMAVVYTGISVANVHLMAATGRAHDLTTLRLAGATWGRLFMIAGCEAALTGVAGALLACLVTAATLAAVAVAVRPLVSTVPLAIPWPPLLATAAACVIAALLAGLLPMAGGARRR